MPSQIIIIIISKKTYRTVQAPVYISPLPSFPLPNTSIPPKLPRDITLHNRHLVKRLLARRGVVFLVVFGEMRNVFGVSEVFFAGVCRALVSWVERREGGKEMDGERRKGGTYSHRDISPNDESHIRTRRRRGGLGPAGNMNQSVNQSTTARISSPLPSSKNKTKSQPFHSTYPKIRQPLPLPPRPPHPLLPAHQPIAIRVKNPQHALNDFVFFLRCDLAP